MDITVYYLKLEDKYWGLFLVSAFLFFALAFSMGREKLSGPGAAGEKNALPKRRELFALSFYGLLAWLLFICPVSWRLLSGFFHPESRYELVSHLFLFPLFLPLAAALAAEKLPAEGKKGTGKKLLFGCFLLLLFFLAGDLFLIPQAGEKGRGFLSGEYAKLYDAILEDAELSGKEPVLWGPSDFLADARLYDARLLPVYGKDIGQQPERYSEGEQLLRQGFDRYEASDAPMENREDQLGALANFPALFPEEGIRYVAIFDPDAEGSGADAEGIFSETGYRRIAEGGGLLIYAK